MPSKRAAARRDAADNVDIDSRLAPFVEHSSVDAVHPPTDDGTDDGEVRRVLVATPSAPDAG